MIHDPRISEAADDLGGGVRARVVDHDQLEVGEVLREHSRDGVRQIPRPVVDRHDDRNTRHGHGRLDSHLFGMS
jgi:hypothetical protein